MGKKFRWAWVIPVSPYTPVYSLPSRLGIYFVAVQPHRTTCGGATSVPQLILADSVPQQQYILRVVCNLALQGARITSGDSPLRSLRFSQRHLYLSLPAVDRSSSSADS